MLGNGALTRYHFTVLDSLVSLFWWWYSLLLNTGPHFFMLLGAHLSFESMYLAPPNYMPGQSWGRFLLLGFAGRTRVLHVPFQNLICPFQYANLCHLQWWALHAVGYVSFRSPDFHRTDTFPAVSIQPGAHIPRICSTWYFPIQAS